MYSTWIWGPVGGKVGDTTVWNKNKTWKLTWRTQDWLQVRAKNQIWCISTYAVFAKYKDVFKK